MVRAGQTGPRGACPLRYSASDQEKYKKFKEERAGAADYMTLDEKGASSPNPHLALYGAHS